MSGEVESSTEFLQCEDVFLLYVLSDKQIRTGHISEMRMQWVKIPSLLVPFGIV
jgi:hypothetical protein